MSVTIVELGIYETGCHEVAFSVTGPDAGLVNRSRGSDVIISQVVRHRCGVDTGPRAHHRIARSANQIAVDMA